MESDDFVKNPSCLLLNLIKGFEAHLYVFCQPRHAVINGNIIIAQRWRYFIYLSIHTSSGFRDVSDNEEYILFHLK